MKKGWEFKELAAVSAINYGYTESASSEPVGPRFLRITDIQDDCVDWKDVPYCKIETSDLAKYRLYSGDIVFARTGATTGKSFLVNEPPKAVFASYLIRLRLHDKKLLPQFVSLFFQTDGYWKSIKDGSSGSAQGGFNATKLGALTIPIPPLPEQKKIVDILNEAFAAIDTAKANAEKNLQNARTLFESHLQSVFTQRGNGWVEKTLEDVCNKITDGTHHSPQTQFAERARGRFPYITSKNIRNNYIDLSNVAYIEKAFHDEVYTRCHPSLGDVLLTKDGANTGNVTLNTIDEPFSLLSSVCLIKTNQALLNPAFLCYYLQSSTGLNSIVGQMTGAAIKRIVLKDIKKAVIPFPPLKEQNSIVAALNSLLDQTQRLSDLYEKKLAAIEALKKSLLNQAFTGQL
jgi:type I restriction enzyme S subunit